MNLRTVSFQKIRVAVFLAGTALFHRLILTSSPALAASGTGGGSGGGTTTILDKGLDGLQALACRIFQWVYTFAIIAGVAFIVLAAIQYMSAGENSEQVKKAHVSLRNAMIGIAVAIIAWGVPNIIGAFLSAKGGGTDFDAACP